MKLRIEQDQNAENPRTNYENFGQIVHWHRRYDFGERIDHPYEWLKNLPNGSLVLSLCLLDHSGLHMWVGNGPHWSDAAGWDSGPVGFIYATPEMIRKEYGCKRISPQTRLKVEKLLRAEVETYDQYLQGDVYGCIIEDDDGNHVDSCWGFFGLKYAEEEGARMLKYAEEHANTEACLI